MIMAALAAPPPPALQLSAQDRALVEAWHGEHSALTVAGDMGMSEGTLYNHWTRLKGLGAIPTGEKRPVHGSGPMSKTPRQPQSYDGRPSVGENRLLGDKLLRRLKLVHGLEGRPDIAPELKRPHPVEPPAEERRNA